MTAYHSQRAAELVKDALAAFDALPITAPGAANHRHLKARRLLAELADQLEAAGAEAERLRGHLETTKTLNETLARQSREADTVMADKLEAYEQENARLLAVHNADAEALFCERSGTRELTAERDALRAENERMRPVVDAACRYRDDGPCFAGIHPAVDAYRAAAPTAGREGEQR